MTTNAAFPKIFDTAEANGWKVESDPSGVIMFQRFQRETTRVETLFLYVDDTALFDQMAYYVDEDDAVVTRRPSTEMVLEVLK